jgi:hypothetical protein
MLASRHAAAVRDENKAERAERRSTWWNGLVWLLAQALFNAHKTRNTQQASNTLNEDRAHTDCRRDSAERNAGMLAHLMDWDQFIRTQAPHIARAQLDASFTSANATYLRTGGHRKKNRPSTARLRRCLQHLRSSISISISICGSNSSS